MPIRVTTTRAPRRKSIRIRVKAMIRASIRTQPKLTADCGLARHFFKRKIVPQSGVQSRTSSRVDP